MSSSYKPFHSSIYIPPEKNTFIIASSSLHRKSCNNLKKIINKRKPFRLVNKGAIKHDKVRWTNSLSYQQPCPSSAMFTFTRPRRLSQERSRTTIYNSIADDYKQTKSLPFRKYVEEYTLFQLLGDLRGKKVLDLACGEGHYTRLIKKHGAETVVGVDVSPSMIQLAKQQEKENHLGCSYVCRDASNLGYINSFDVAVGVYLCCNADTSEAMAQFAHEIHKNLKDGGCFIGIEKLNLENDSQQLVKYHIVHENKQPLREGDTLGISFINPDENYKICDIKTFFWREPTYENAFLRAAGFRNFQWKGPFLDPNLPHEYPEEYWEEFIRYKGIVGMQAQK